MTDRPASPTGAPVRAWADLVFHVLAHVHASRHLRASLFDSTYVRFAEGHLGPSSNRHLAEDADVLGRCLPDDASLARAQGLAWLFESVEHAERTAAHDLANLAPSDVSDPARLASLASAGPAVEVLRLASLLEREHHARLPRIEIDAAALGHALDVVRSAAPGLGACRVVVVPTLRLRGRVRGDEIWVGAPHPALACSFAHVVWQAAHEATVRDIARSVVADATPTVDDIEHAALVLLAERAAAARLTAEHSLWLANLHPEARRLAHSEPTGVAATLLTRARARRH